LILIGAARFVEDLDETIQVLLLHGGTESVSTPL